MSEQVFSERTQSCCHTIKYSKLKFENSKWVFAGLVFFCLAQEHPVKSNHTFYTHAHKIESSNKNPEEVDFDAE